MEIVDEYKELFRDASVNVKAEPPLSPSSLVELEEHGIVLPHEMRGFYSFCNGAQIGGGSSAWFHILALDELSSEKRAFEPKFIDVPRFDGNYLAFCEIADGDFIAMPLGPFRSIVPIVVLNHEQYPDFDSDDLAVVAVGFKEFVATALTSGRYWWIN